MNYSMIRILIFKDWYLQRWTVLASLRNHAGKGIQRANVNRRGVPTPIGALSY